MVGQLWDQSLGARIWTGAGVAKQGSKIPLEPVKTVFSWAMRGLCLHFDVAVATVESNMGVLWGSADGRSPSGSGGLLVRLVIEERGAYQTVRTCLR